MNLRKVILYGAGIVLLALWCGHLWSGERQVRVHQQRLLNALQHKRWGTLEGLLSPKYSDRWGHDKQFVVGACRQVFGWMSSPVIDRQMDAPEMGEGLATIRGRIQIHASGEMGTVVADRVNGLASPFVFEWSHASWKPWDWQLVSVEQPELDLGDE